MSTTAKQRSQLLSQKVRKVDIFCVANFVKGAASDDSMTRLTFNCNGFGYMC